MAESSDYGFTFSLPDFSSMRFAPGEYLDSLGSAITPYIQGLQTQATLATHGPVGSAVDAHRPTFKGSTHSINPHSGEVNILPPDVDVHPDADPEPVIDKKTASDLEPYHNRFLQWIESVGDPNKPTALPGSDEYYKHLGIHTSQQGLPDLRYLGPFGRIIHAFSPKHQSLLRQQQAADQIGQKLLEVKGTELSSGPNTVGEAEQLFGRGIIPLNPNQLTGAPLEAGKYGPETPSNPEALLTLPQQVGITSPLMKGLASGNLVRDPETGQLITSWQASARENPQFLDFPSAQKAIESLPYTPKGFILPTDSKGRVPASVYNAAEQRYAATQNQLNPDMGNDRESITRRMTTDAGFQPMSYNQMLQHPQARVLAPQIDEAYKKLQQDVAGARAYGGGNSKLDLPLENKDAAAIFDKEHFDKTGEMKPLTPDMANGGMSDRYARSKGLYIGEKDREQLANVDQSGANLDAIFQQAGKLMTAKTAKEALIQAAKIYAAGHPVSRFLLQQADPEFDSAGAATYLDSLKALSNNLSKAFGGERGVLTNVDVQRWVNAMPRPSDTAEIREKKAVLLQRLYGEAKKAQLRAIRGDMSAKDRTELGKSLKPTLDELEKLDKPQDSTPLGKLSPGEKEFAQDAIRKGVPQDELERMLRATRKQQ